MSTTTITVPTQPPPSKPDADGASWRKWRTMFEPYACSKAAACGIRIRKIESQHSLCASDLRPWRFTRHSHSRTQTSENRWKRRSNFSKNISSGSRTSSGYERWRFNTRNQEEGETFRDYVTELRRLARGCEFDSITPQQILRDRIVCGIKDKNLIRSMIGKKDLTFVVLCVKLVLFALSLHFIISCSSDCVNLSIGVLSG